MSYIESFLQSKSNKTVWETQRNKSLKKTQNKIRETSTISNRYYVHAIYFYVKHQNLIDSQDVWGNISSTTAIGPKLAFPTYLVNQYDYGVWRRSI